MQSSRLFVAVPLTEDVREALVAVQGCLRPAVEGCVRWERAANLHVTMKFLGDVRADGVQPVLDAVRAVAAECEAAVLPAAAVDAFPRPSRPRVVVVRLTDPGGTLARAAAELEDALARLGHPREERPFRPHITIGRARANARVHDLTDALAAGSLEGVPDIVANLLVVYESTLAPSGATYAALSEERLRFRDDAHS